MYIFERLVSWLARQIHDRAQPERNLANNVAFGIGLANRLNCQQDQIKKKANSIGGTAEKIFRKLGLLEDDTAQAENLESAYTLPKRIASAVPITLATLRDMFEDVSGYSEMQSVLTPEAKIFRVGENRSFAPKVNNHTRKTVGNETPIGSPIFTRRYSGFCVKSNNNCNNIVGKIQSFYVVNSVLFVVADVFLMYHCRWSRLPLVKLANVTRCIMRAEEIGSFRVFAPWTGKKSVTEIDPDVQCVLEVPDRPTTRNS
jgi:hypothetical protein